MVLGTCSNAGKSLIAKALCRMLRRLGLRVAPFKAQNMALNAAVTPDGGEIGRAQALQAEACDLLPDVRMNPLLLKPMGDHTAELVVLGKSSGILRAQDFATFRADLWEIVQKAYAELAGNFDCMILEGAGSPAEINLREHDLVNMRMALHAGAGVLLTADIDRGGAFAALVGTMALLQENERATVRGYILNKFRGDASLLAPAIREVEALTGKPFLATIPWIPKVLLPDEDSVSIQAASARHNPPADVLDVAVIQFPHISNSSDFDALASEPDMALRYVDRPAFFGSPDLVILPGSRTTADDCDWLFRSGLAELLLGYSGHIVGLCGGFQIMGRTLSDPLGEDCVFRMSTIKGLDLLPLATSFAKEKTLRTVCARMVHQGQNEALPVLGYEIHRGETIALGPDALPVCIGPDGDVLGYGLRRDPLRVWGTYVHGIFDCDTFRNVFVNHIRRAKGLPSRAICPYRRREAIDRVADTVSQVLRVEVLQGLLGV